MAQTVEGRWWSNGSGWAGARPVTITVRVWRRVAGEPQGLFTFAGAVDAAILHAVMQHVRRLTRAVPGRWRVEIVAAGLDGPLLHHVEAALFELRRVGLQSRLALAPRAHAELGLALARAALALPPSSLPH